MTHAIGCRDAVERLWSYLDGELDGEQTDRVVAHLAKCRLCRRRAAVSRQIRRSLQAMAPDLDT